MFPSAGIPEDAGMAVQQLLDILDVLESAAPGISVESVADATHLPVEYVELYLENLVSRGYVERVPATRTYHLALGSRDR